MAVIVRNSQSAIYKGLSSFWIKYFKDSPQLESIYMGAEQLFGQAYLDLMETLLSKSLTTLPIFKKEEYKLLIIQEDQLSFSTAVKSSATRKINNVTFSLKADTLSPDYDDVVITFVDIDTVEGGSEASDYYPYVGLYNNAVTTKSPDAKYWTAVLPSNKTIVDAVHDLKSQILSNKPIATVTATQDAEFTISLNEGEKELKVKVPIAVLGGATSGIVTSIQTQLGAPASSLITVSQEAGYLRLKTTSGKSIRVVSANTSAEQTLFLKAFNFTISLDIPVEEQNTEKYDRSYNFQVRTAGFKDEGSEYRFSVGGPGLVESQAVASNGAITSGSTTFTVQAYHTDKTHDGETLSFIDLANVTTVGEQTYFPQPGVYNNYLAGKDFHDNKWTVVLPNSSASIAAAITEVSSSVNSSKAITYFGDGDGNPITFTLAYDEEGTDKQNIEVSLTSLEWNNLTDITGLVSLLSTKITHSDVVVSNSTGYLKIASTLKKSLRVIKASVQTNKLLHLVVFPFKITVSGTVNTVWTSTSYLNVTTAGYKQPTYKYPYAKDNDKYLRHIKYMMNTLYDPSLILEETKHYRVEEGYVYFEENPFKLQNVAYRYVGTSKQIAFWLGDVLYDNTLLYERYGHRFVDRQASSEAYKLLIRGILYYYTNGPDVSSIISALNLVAGIPIVENNGEKVISVTPTLITTDQNSYEVPDTADALVSVGDTVNAFDVLVDAFQVEDYVNSPGWFDNFTVPESLMPGLPENQRLLKKEVRPVTIGDASFIIGDENPVAEEFLTDSIPPYTASSYPYSMSVDASFQIEIPSLHKVIPVYIPITWTTQVLTLSEMASIIQNAARQLTCNPIVGDPSSNIVVDTDATFTVNGSVVTITEGTYTSLADIANRITTKLTVLFPSDDFQVLINPATTTSQKSLVFASKSGKAVSIHSVSPTAHRILGILGKESYTDMGVSAVEDKLKFIDNSTEADVLFKITNISVNALSKWKMQPMLAGSGDMIGTRDDQGRGQPNLSYKLFDDILKYNTFKVSFNIKDVNTDIGGLDDIVDLVMKGRPKYVTPFIAPSHLFKDTYSTYDTPIPYTTYSSFPFGDHPSHVFETTPGRVVNLTFSSIKDTRILYENNYQDARFISLGKAGVTIPVPGAANSKIRLDYKPGIALGRTNHRITFGTQNNITDPSEQVRFSYPGIYNYGIQTRGEVPDPKKYSDVNTKPVTTGDPVIYGIFAIDPNNMWVSEPERIGLHSSITHFMVLDSYRHTSLTDLGFGEGDKLVLSGWNNSGNNGEFTILNVSYGVKPDLGPGVDTSSSSVDVIWFSNSSGVAENAVTPSSFVGDKCYYTFKYKPGWIGKKWYITVPYNSETTPQRVATVSEMLAAFAKIKQDGSYSDDGEHFPFDLSLVGEDHVWTTSKVEVTTGLADQEEFTSIAERWQVTRDWDRKFIIGGDWYNYRLQANVKWRINPGDRIIGAGAFRRGAKYVGEDSNRVTATGDPTYTQHVVGMPDSYLGGDFSTVDDKVFIQSVSV